MAQEIGQTSRHQPAVVYDEVTGTFHMVFSANDDSNRIFYATSDIYQGAWRLGPEPGQSTGAAPALALYQTPVGINNVNNNLLVLVFVANDPSNLSRIFSPSLLASAYRCCSRNLAMKAQRTRPANRSAAPPKPSIRYCRRTSIRRPSWPGSRRITAH
jgi:hypothetical protein